MVDTFGLIQKYTGISKYSQSEVITPQNIVSDMVDLLPQEVFNPDATFFDPAVKSGRFLIEIYNRLMASPLLAHIPEQDRHEHILTEQLYGFATSPTAATVVRKALYSDPLVTGNIRFTSGKVTKELVQGAFNIMKFDVVIGNPPYNKGMDLDFVDIGFELSKQYTVMITPAKWQTADANQGVASKNMTYGKFREKLVPHMSKVVFYPDCGNIFRISQVDGISYFLMDKKMHETVDIENRCKNQKYYNSKDNRSIIHRESLCNIGNEIVTSLGSYSKYKIDSIPKDKRYQVWTNNQLTIGGQGGQENYLLSITGSHNAISISRILDSHDAVDMGMRTGASTCSFSSDDKQECECFVSWLNTKFTRFFVAINISKLTGIICDDCFRFVPAPPSGKFDHIYTDDELYKDFNLPQKYIDVIEAVVKERK